MAPDEVKLIFDDNKTKVEFYDKEKDKWTTIQEIIYIQPILTGE